MNAKRLGTPQQIEDKGKKVDLVYIKHEIDNVTPIILDPNELDKVGYVGKELSIAKKNKLVELLMDNRKIFGMMTCLE